jgi:uncharacterized protein YbbC (DUF1343 family)
MKKYIYTLVVLFTLYSCNIASNNDLNKKKHYADTTKIIVGAEQISEYLHLIKNKKIALLVNQTSLVGSTHLVDTLLSLGINITKIFAPEHGFRGKEERGVNFKNHIDKKTGLPIISLVGKNKAPTSYELKNVDVVIYDLQDVGARFYTYISTMYLLMQSCAQNNKTLIILDRPNPNGDYVAGPVLDTAHFRSFVGMLPIPVVYGMTPAELALMINGENWLNTKNKCKLVIIKLKNYSHSKHYSLPVKPSPNLPNDLSIRLYPSLCFFEATNFSIGRGTKFPFQVIGYPDKRFGKFTFIPHDIKGVQTNPIDKNKICYGIDLRKCAMNQKFTLKFIIDFYKKSQNDIKFFTKPRWFDLLIGNGYVRKMIINGNTYEQIKARWQKELNNFKEKRKKYLLYAL